MSPVGGWRGPVLLAALVASLAAPACLTEAFVDPEGRLGCDDQMLDACGGECVNLDTDPEHCGTCGRECEDDEACTEGECVPVCMGEDAVCGGACVDLDFDDQNCGDCGEACGFAQTCLYGECRANDDFTYEPGCDECPCDQCPPEWTCATVPNQGVVCLEDDDADE